MYPVILEGTQWLSRIYCAPNRSWIPDKCYAFSGMTTRTDSPHTPAPSFWKTRSGDLGSIVRRIAAGSRINAAHFPG